MIEPGCYVTNWMTSSELKGHLELGDRIEFRRVLGTTKRLYGHWAIFVGLFNDEPCVCHMSAEGDDFADSLQKLTCKLNNRDDAQVRKNTLSVVANGDYCRINNSLDEKRRPFPPNCILDRAMLMLGSGRYNILSNNCEHFVNYCRYGAKESQQISDKALTTSALIGLGFLAVFSPSLAAAVSLASFTIGKWMQYG